MKGVWVGVGVRKCGLTQPLVRILKGMVLFTMWLSHTLLPHSSTNTEASRLLPSGPWRSSGVGGAQQQTRTSHGECEWGLKSQWHRLSLDHDATTLSSQQANFEVSTNRKCSKSKVTRWKKCCGPMNTHHLLRRLLLNDLQTLWYLCVSPDFYIFVKHYCDSISLASIPEV